MSHDSEQMLYCLGNYWPRLELNPDEEKLRKIAFFYEYLMEVNRKMNLTRIVDPCEAAIKHFYDSLTVLKAETIPLGARAADVGTGAGFPGIPLAIFRPDLELVLVDSRRKRIGFLEDLVAMLKLDQVTLVHSRAEDFARERRFRESFDFVFARAVASLPALTELCLPLIRIGGTFLAMKGPKADEEAAEACRAIQLLGGSTPRLHKFTLPVTDETRIVVAIPKIRSTPLLYPRKAGIPEKQPLK